MLAEPIDVPSRARAFVARRTRSRLAHPGHVLLLLFGTVLAAMGLALAAGGLRLATLGGSWYYLLAGSGMALSGVLFARRRLAGAWLYALVFAGTVPWSLWEVGTDFWQLVPRLVGVIVLAVAAILLLPLLVGASSRLLVIQRAYPVAGLLVMVLGWFAVQAFEPQGVIHAANAGVLPANASPGAPMDWRHYGGTPAGTRFAHSGDIGGTNVGSLQVAWTFRTGEAPSLGDQDQNTPLQAGNTLFACTPRNQVIALDAETGALQWRFDPKTSPGGGWQRCRGVGYYEGAAPDGCTPRIIMTTVDARLIALDAATGGPCEGFGRAGVVDLKEGMGEIKPGYYFQTSAPTVVRNLIVVGGWVFDGRSTDEPSGVVRAFSATTGALVWAWDSGNPHTTRLPPEGRSYTRSTPNVWSTPAFDDELGLIYLPTGNGTPDYWGASRSSETEAHSSAIVALDIETGRKRWAFQTVHHDLWDYDVPAQPALYDIPDGRGGRVPALVQVTKRGQIFLLDRRTGAPLAEVREKAVPGGSQEGDWTSPTQPYSALPSIGTEPLTEARMWGATFFDQLWCRIAFRKLRYEGEFTPPTTTRSLQYPGAFGGMNWGSASLHEPSGHLYVNDIRVPYVIQLITPAEGEARTAAGGDVHPQLGTPYALSRGPFLSPLGIPCQAPPYGTLTAIDLNTREIAWQTPMGTVQDTGPRGVRTGLQIPIGMPTLGGTLVTASGLVFFAGTQDYYLRAIDARNGRELWKSRLPVGSQATPMSYVSAQCGRQFIVVSAGGARSSRERGDYIVAYALPESVSRCRGSGAGVAGRGKNSNAP